MRTARQVAKWLKSIHRTQSVRPCIVTIGTETYEGASYECVGEYIPNMDAIVHGERKPGDIYIQRSIYLVGNVPTVVKERRRTCFTFEGQDWYLAAHSDPGIKPAERMPFGSFIIIDPWTCPSKIDGERPYRRVPMMVKLGRCV
jgi:hypothetical protein